MILLTAIATALGVLVALYTVGQVLLRWRAHGIPEVRRISGYMRDIFGDVIAHGGLDVTHFTSPDRRALANELADLRNQLRNRELEHEVAQLLACWNHAFATASPPDYGYVRTGSPSSAVTPRSPDWFLRVRLQTQHARDGEEQVRRVLARCNELTRFVVREAT